MRQTARQPNHWSEHRGCLLSAVLAEDTSVCVWGGLSGTDRSAQTKTRKRPDAYACMHADRAPDVVLYVWNSILRHERH